MRIGYNKDTDPGKYGAVILAAGLSSRMKDFKPLLHVDGRTAIEGLAETLRSSGIGDILVVTGFSREKLRPHLSRLRLTEVVNDDYRDGMFTSIKRGLAEARKLWPQKRGIFILPVDCPLISIHVIKELMQADEACEGSNDDPARFLVPIYEGKKGHPMLMPCVRVDEVLSYDGPDGLKGITDAGTDSILRVPVKDEGCVMDMDTPENYEEICRFVERGFKREKLSVLAGRRRLILVRHGQTKQHDGPVFTGQYDVPLNDEGMNQAREAAEKIAELIEPDVTSWEGWVEGVSLGGQPMKPIEGIYSSDLSRAAQTAEIVAKAINDLGKSTDVHVRTREDLREIALGEWDGRSVEEIKAAFPEQYEARGRDIFTFKIGNDSENFYDMQYRVVKGLRSILEEDEGRNVIIVAHSGVIRAIENNLKGLRVDDDWEPVAKGSIRIWESPIK